MEQRCIQSSHNPAARSPVCCIQYGGADSRQPVFEISNRKVGDRASARSTSELHNLQKIIMINSTVVFLAAATQKEFIQDRETPTI